MGQWPGPLAGIRIVDFGWWAIGALTTRVLAYFGAEVIKIEDRAHPDIARLTPPFPQMLPAIDEAGSPKPNISGLFNNNNANKLSMVLSMRDPRGRDIVRRLVAVSDVVSENFRPGVMERWGLDYAALREVKNDIIFARLGALGYTGPEASYGASEPVIGALAGLAATDGLPGREPAGWGSGSMAPAAACYGAIAILLALHRRDETGEGQEVTGASVEAGVNLLGPDLLDSTANGRPYRREGMPPGNRLTGRPAAPHGVYPTQGEDRWIAIAVFNDDEWERLVGVMGRPGWALEPSFRCIEERMCHQDELDRRMAEWTKGQERYDLMERLQTAGVRAGVVQTSQDVSEVDPQIGFRGMFAQVDNPLTGRYPVDAVPFKMMGSPPREVWRSGPRLGEHTAYVLTEILGMGSREVEELAREGVI